MPLASGGMARIYLARATGIGSFERHVVLKMILPERTNDATSVQMFLDEARLSASLHHQNVAQVFEVGEDAGIHYLAMEYVHGQDLRALIAKAGAQGLRVPLELALTAVAGAAAGLDHAHNRRGPDGAPLGIVHRDVSPSNVMIGYDGSVKVLDFGIAKATARGVETQSGVIKGKFAYMAPEQCRGRPVDRRSDVFSLGILLYEASTQHRCFRANSDFDTMHRIVTGDIVPPSTVVRDYPPDLERVVMTALAVDPAKRFASAAALLEAIENVALSLRVPLSQTALGRFMRELFGDVPEPWLAGGRANSQLATPPAHETTISNTDGHLGAGAPAAAPPLAGGAASAASAVDDALLELLPSPAPVATVERASSPALRAPVVAMPVAPVPAALTPAPAVAPALAVDEIAPTSPRPTVGRSDGGVTASNATAAPLRRSKWPYLTAALFAVVVVIVVAVMAASSKKAPATPAMAAVPAHAPSVSLPVEPLPPSPVVAPAPTPAPTVPPVVQPPPNVALHIRSTPSGASVTLDGASLGKTPLDTTTPREDSGALIVHLDGYRDASVAIALRSDISQSVELTAVPPPAPTLPPAPTPVVRRDPPPVPSHRDRSAKPNCQKPGPNLDPFGPPVCAH